MLKILFFTHPYQDYLADSLLHGFKSLEEVKVYDYPRKNILYKNGKNDRGITGNGMTLYYLLDDDKINRFDLFYPLLFNKFNHKYDEFFNKKYDLVICDEINNAVHDGLLTEKQLAELLEDKHPKTSLCVTGRNFPKELLPLTDIATNMTKIKHHFDDKFLANPGIDY